MEYTGDFERTNHQIHTKKTNIYVIDKPLNNEENTEYNSYSASEDNKSRPNFQLPLSENMDSLGLYKAPFWKKMSSLRWKVCVMCCAVVSISFTVRQCISMAIVCMTSQRNPLLGNTSLLNITENIGDTGRNELYVDWDSTTEGLVLSSYFYTYPLSPVLSGYLSGKYSAKYITVLTMLLMSVASIVIPHVALINPPAVMGLRALVGFGAGGWMPCLNQLLNSGSSIGKIISFVFSGLICKIPVLGGWPFIFYIFSAANLLIIFIWVLVIYNSPEEHPRSNEPEIKYILEERKINVGKMPSPPWIKLLTSGPVWAIMIAQFCFVFILTILGSFLPLYMNDVLKFDPATNGLLSSLPFIGRFFAAMVFGSIADKCIERRLMSTGMVRKMFQCISMIGSAPFLIGLSFLTEEQRTLAVALLVIYWILQSSSNAAFQANHLDIAPIYTGVISGITYTCGSLAAVVSPSIVTAINQNKTREEWQIIFYLCVGVGLFGAVAFCILGSGEMQNWAKGPNLSLELEVAKSPNLKVESTKILNISSYKTGSPLYVQYIAIYI